MTVRPYFIRINTKGFENSQVSCITLEFSVPPASLSVPFLNAKALVINNVSLLVLLLNYNIYYRQFIP